jgi:hypothetical protein
MAKPLNMHNKKLMPQCRNTRIRTVPTLDRGAGGNVGLAAALEAHQRLQPRHKRAISARLRHLTR